MALAIIATHLVIGLTLATALPQDLDLHIREIARTLHEADLKIDQYREAAQETIPVNASRL